MTGNLSNYLSLVGSVLLLSIIFYPFELLVPAERNQAFMKRLVNLAYVPIFLIGIVFVLQPIANAFVSKLFTVTGSGVLPRWIGPPQSFAYQLLFALAFAVWWDLWQYWLHRLQHSVPWLWETHKFHHSETALNATTQSRHHLVHSALTVIFYLPVVLMIGTYSPHYLAIFVLFRLWGFVNHANLRISFGKLTPLVSGPQWHRIHHSVVDAHHDKNFATFFPLIDIIFGTYYRPIKGEFPPTGLPGETANPLSEATIGPIVAWLRSSRKLIHRSDSLSANES